MAAAANVPKLGVAPPEMGGYPFVRDIDVSDTARALYAKHGIAYYPPSMVSDITEQCGETAKGKPIYRSIVRLRFKLVNVDDPSDSHEWEWAGIGDDTADKGLSKAGTSCVKGTLTKALLIGGEPAHDSDATDATGGEGRTHQRTASAPSVNPADDYGPCDEPGCAGRLIGKDVNKKDGTTTRVLKCSLERYKDRGSCDRQTDWRPNWKQWEAYRDRHADGTVPDANDQTPIPFDGAPSVTPSITGLWAMLCELPDVTRASLLKAAGYVGGNQKPEAWLALLPDDKRHAMKVAVEDISAAQAKAS